MTIAELLDPTPSAAARKGHFMRLASGTKYWPLDPRPEEVFIDDIAESLSKLCRFNGHPHGGKFYSVAEHSVWCSLAVPPEHAFEALMHDAAEAYTGDIIRPIKIIAEVAAAFKPIERLNEVAIAERFNLAFPFHAWIKRADEMVCTRELRTIMAGNEHERDEDQAVCNTLEEAAFEPQCWIPQRAREAFLRRFQDLLDRREPHVNYFQRRLAYRSCTKSRSSH